MEVGVLKVNNFCVWAFHGWYQEERMLGGEYSVDVEVQFTLHGQISEIDDTINYEIICDVIKQMMKKSCRLIEEITSSIFKALQDLSENVIKLTVTVTKLSVPIPFLGSTSFTLTS